MQKKKISKKGQVVLYSLIVALGLSGCSFKLGTKEGKIESTYSTEYEDESSYHGINSNSAIDEIMGFKDNSSNKESLEYTYLIDDSINTSATFAHVVDEKTLTNDGKLFDGKEEVDLAVLGNELIQPITLPIAFTLFNIDDVGTLTDGYGDCELTGKKLFTLDGETLYYFESTFTFNSFAEKYICLGINEGDTMTATALYKVDSNGHLELLSRSQKGFKDDSPNVEEVKYNDSGKIVVPLENTVFADMSGEYSIEYLKEALDVYSGEDYYYDSSNDGIDFSKYKKY